MAERKARSAAKRTSKKSLSKKSATRKPARHRAVKKPGSCRVDPKEAVQDVIVIRSKRVCALCWAFEHDGRSKRQGQLAHIDRDNSNSDEENLAWLCLACHDTYDSTPRQTKRLRPAELAAHKASVEALVQAGRLPSGDSSGTALLSVELDFALAKAFGREMGLFEVWCIFANEGERATGIKRAYLKRNGQRITSLAYFGGLDEDGNPGKQDAWHADAEYLFLTRGQMVAPGQCRMWAASFAPPLEAIEDLDLQIRNFRTNLDPPLHVVFEPVIGSPVLVEVAEVNINPEGVYPKR